MVVNANDFTSMDVAGDAVARLNAGTRPKGEKSNPNLFNDLSEQRGGRVVRPVDIALAFSTLKCPYGCGWVTKVAPDDERNLESVDRAKREADDRVTDHKVTCATARERFEIEQKKSSSGLSREEVMQIVDESVGKALDSKLDAFLSKLVAPHKEPKVKRHAGSKKVRRAAPADRQDAVGGVGRKGAAVEADAPEPRQDEPQA